MRFRVLEPLRTSDYRRLWLGHVVSVTGDKLNQIAMGVMVYKITGSMLHMGVMIGITFLPSALFGLVAGAYVDRWDLRRTMIVTDVLRAGLVLAIPWAMMSTGVYSAYLIAFAVATLGLFFVPAKMSLVPKIIAEDELLAANSLDNATTSVAELGGLAAAAALVVAIGYNRAFAIDAASYLFSAVMIARIAWRPSRLPRGATDGVQTLEAGESASTDVAGVRSDAATGVLAEVAEGARYILSTPVLRQVIALGAVAATGIGATITLTYALALQRFEAGASGLALLDAAIGVGLLAGAVLAGRSELHGSGTRAIAGLAGLAFFFGAAALAPSIWVAAPLMMLVGIADMWFIVPSVTLVQRASREALRGRVLAARHALLGMTGAVGVMAAGVAVQYTGVAPTMLAVAVLVLLAAAWGWTRPGVRAA